MYKYKCECGYSGNYLVPHYKSNIVKCPKCSKTLENIVPRDIELPKLNCPYCNKENDGERLTHYMALITCKYCGRNFEAKKRVRYFIK